MEYTFTKQEKPASDIGTIYAKITPSYIFVTLVSAALIGGSLWMLSDLLSGAAFVYLVSKSEVPSFIIYLVILSTFAGGVYFLYSMFKQNPLTIGSYGLIIDGHKLTYNEIKSARIEMLNNIKVIIETNQGKIYVSNHMLITKKKKKALDALINFLNT